MVHIAYMKLWLLKTARSPAHLHYFFRFNHYAVSLVGRYICILQRTPLARSLLERSISFV